MVSTDSLDGMIEDYTCTVQLVWCIGMPVQSICVYCETVSKGNWLYEQVDLVS